MLNFEINSDLIATAISPQIKIKCKGLYLRYYIDVYNELANLTSAISLTTHNTKKNILAPAVTRKLSNNNILKTLNNKLFSSNYTRHRIT